jgi:D-alanyl-D-alanine dipeptidase
MTNAEDLMAKTLSSSAWVQKFPNSTSTDDLVDPFKSNAKKFIAALRKSGATVAINATLRPKERVYLMYWSFKIAGGWDPEKAEEMAGVGIEWVHRDAYGKKDIAASKAAAGTMVAGYGIAYEPAKISRHSAGTAIDMDIAWSAGTFKITDGAGKDVTIKSTPKGGGNTDLHLVGKSYGAIKLVSDPPHWSSDGH